LAIDSLLDKLRLEVEDLRASRARVVVAADTERRRIARDLHDGAQQNLIGVSVHLQLVSQLVESDPGGAKALLEEIGRDVREALERVRELASGIYPPVLLDFGLAEALRAAASEAGIRTQVTATPLERYPPEVEGTAYFCCVEAVRNAARNASPEARATIRLWGEPGALLFEVVIAGAGFEQRESLNGAGLTKISDRLGALGGQLTISAEPGQDTRISATIPLAP
jgi:signal transduction histidine kinase